MLREYILCHGPNNYEFGGGQILGSGGVGWGGGGGGGGGEQDVFYDGDDGDEGDEDELHAPSDPPGAAGGGGGDVDDPEMGAADLTVRAACVCLVPASCVCCGVMGGCGKCVDTCVSNAHQSGGLFKS